MGHAVPEGSKPYTGYRSYSYLEPGTDYKEFKLAAEIGRVPEYAGLALSADQAERARRLLDDNIVISLHDHPSVFPDDVTRDHRLQPGRPPPHRLRGPRRIRA